MRSICPYPPVFEPPLGHRFGFRAVMFQGMKSGDEMIMNVKIVGCIDQNDCSVIQNWIYFYEMNFNFKSGFFFFNLVGSTQL